MSMRTAHPGMAMRHDYNAMILIASVSVVAYSKSQQPNYRTRSVAERVLARETGVAGFEHGFIFAATNRRPPRSGGA